MSDSQPPFGGGQGPPAPGPDHEPDGEPTQPESPSGPGDPAAAREGEGGGGGSSDLDADAVLEEAASIVEADIAAILAERDDYLGSLRRVQADFENFRKQTIKRNTELIERAGEELIEKLLPVLDACDGALQHGATDIEPIATTLLGTLEKEGLSRIAAQGEAFDPTVHEAVMHEAADDGSEPTVVEVLRSGYLWKGRVLRPALVKVKG